MIELDVNDSETRQVGIIVNAVAAKNPAVNWLFESPGGSLCAPRYGAPELVELGPESMGTILRAWLEPGVWNKDDTGGTQWAPRPSIPIRLVKSYMSKKDWPGVAKIKRAVYAPIVRPDFSIRWEPGWDEASELWVLPGATMDDKFSRSDVERLFTTFAFADPTFLTDAIGCALTPYLTSALSKPFPGLLITARQPESGKTELARIISILSNSGLPEPQAWRGASEMRKAITTALHTGERIVLFDNVKASIDSPELEAVITSRSWADRRMATHDMMRLNNDTFWVVTRNNPDVSSDMARRMILVLLDKYLNPAAWNPVIVARAQAETNGLVTAMIRMIEVWSRAGRPAGSVVMSGFEEWSQAVSGILEANGFTGFMSSRTSMLDTAVVTDDEDDGEIIARIAAIMGVETRWSAGELWDNVNDLNSYSIPGVSLLRVWLNASHGGAEPAKSVGRRVSQLVGRRVKDSPYYIEKVARRYVVKPVTELKSSVV